MFVPWFSCDFSIVSHGFPMRCSHDLSRGIGSSQGALLGCCAMVFRSPKLEMWTSKPWFYWQEMEDLGISTVISKGWTNKSSSITHNPNRSNKNEGLNVEHGDFIKNDPEEGYKGIAFFSEDGSFQKWLDEQCGKPNATNYRINQPWLVVILHHPNAKGWYGIVPLFWGTWHQGLSTAFTGFTLCLIGRTPWNV